MNYTVQTRLCTISHYIKPQQYYYSTLPLPNGQKYKKSLSLSSLTAKMTITIDGEYSTSTHSLHTVNLDGTSITVTVTSKASVVRRWIHSTKVTFRPYLGRFIVGIGVQWDPYYYSDTSADTLTLCVGTRCLVYQLTQSPFVPRALRRFLQDPGNISCTLYNPLHIFVPFIYSSLLLLNQYLLEILGSY